MLIRQPQGTGAAFLKLPHFSSWLRMTAEVVHPALRAGKRGNVCTSHFVSFIRKAKDFPSSPCFIARIKSHGHLATKEINIF